MILKNKIKRVVKSQKFHLSGWVVSAVLLGALLTTGANDPKGKTGKVDFDRILQESKLGKQKAQALQDASKSREDLLKFLDNYRVASKTQAEKIKHLFLIEKPADNDKKELESLKQQIINEDAKRIQLSQKKDLSEGEKKILSAYSENAMAVGELLQQWSTDFNEDLYSLRQKASQETYEKAKSSLSKTAKTQGYSKIFNHTTLPYCANDVTEATIKEMDRG
jgi:Skp family chaperone for outer membrane proteins